MKPFDEIMTKYERKVEELTSIIPSITLSPTMVFKSVDDSVIR